MITAMTIPSEVANGESKGSRQRTPAFPLDKLPGALPLAKVDDDTDAASIAQSNLPKLANLRSEHLTQDAVWRDSLALTGTFRTFSSAHVLLKAWKATSATHGPVEFAIRPNTARIVRVGPDSSWVDAAFTFKNTAVQPQQTCSGFISLVPTSNGEWKIWMLRTILEQVDGWGNVDVLEPSQQPNPINGTHETTNGTLEDEAKHFSCIVVGGGQAGLGIGGRLQALGTSYLIVDKHPEVGDSWNARYDSTKCELSQVCCRRRIYLTEVL